MEKVLATLKSKRVGEKRTAFPKDPTDSRARENEAFKAFGTLAEDIITVYEAEMGSDDLKGRVALRHNPNGTPKSSRRDSSSLPDGCFLLLPNPGFVSDSPPFAALMAQVGKGSETGVYWEDIAIPIEYNKKTGEAGKNDVGTLTASDDRTSSTDSVERSHNCLESASNPAERPLPPVHVRDHH